MADRSEPLKFGIFAQPFHQPGEHPTVAYERDMEVIELLDRLNFDEAGSASITAPAGKPSATRRCSSRRRPSARGTSASARAWSACPTTTPSRSPIAWSSFDHLTRGRINFGVGPGALYSDAYQLGIEPTTQRRRMGEAARRDHAPAARRGRDGADRVVRAARRAPADGLLPAAPRPGLRRARGVAGRRAGRRAPRPGDALRRLLRAERRPRHDVPGLDVGQRGGRAARHGGRSPRLAHHHDHAPRRLPGRGAGGHPRGVLALNHGYFGTLGIRFEGGRDSVDWLANQPGVAIGTPDDATAAIEEVLEASGGVGGILINHREWARTTGRMRRSYELFARHVMPRFQGQAQPFEDSLEWAARGASHALPPGARGATPGLRRRRDRGAGRAAPAWTRPRAGRLAETPDRAGAALAR